MSENAVGDQDFEKDLDRIADELVSKILALPKGTETSITGLIGDGFANYSSKQLHKIFERVFYSCKEKGIKFNFDKYDNQTVGLIFNIPFVIEQV